MNDKYLIRRIKNINDFKMLLDVYHEVFYPEKVDEFARQIHNSFPGVKNKHWLVAEDVSSHKIVSGMALIPWIWKINGIEIKVAELGLVATCEQHRGKGLMRKLNAEFDKQLADEHYDLACIQGIPGFYHKFGYHYTIPMENHINLDLGCIDESYNSEQFRIRKADFSDITFLMSEDEKYRHKNFISSFRSKQQWEYILSDGKKTEYGSDVYMIESENEKYYCRVLYVGFGRGLIVSEVSYSMHFEAMNFLLYQLRQMAEAEEKPFIRFNIPAESTAGRFVIALGAEKSKSYAWQIKIPNKIRCLNKLKPVFNERLKHSGMNNCSDTFRLDFFSESIDIALKNGIIESIGQSFVKEVENVFYMPADLFAVLVLGHRNWEQLQYFRPDIGPANIYHNPELKPSDDKTWQLMNVLFPTEASWVYLPY